MIKDLTYHDTQAEADGHGQVFKESWGWGYSPTYSIGQVVSFNFEDEPVKRWWCMTYRFASCD